MWFYMICRVAIRVVKGGLEAEDPRSDEESDEIAENDVESFYEDEGEVLNGKLVLVEMGDRDLRPLEEEVGVEDIDFKRMKSMSRVPMVGKGGGRRGKMSSGMSSGVHIPGAIARKELLDRIGCDKPID